MQLTPIQAAVSQLGVGARRRVTLRKACCSRAAPPPPPSRHSQSGAAGAPWWGGIGRTLAGRQGEPPRKATHTHTRPRKGTEPGLTCRLVFGGRRWLLGAARTGRCVRSDSPGSSPQTGHKVRGGRDGGAEPGTRGDTALGRADLTGRDKGSGGIQVGRRGQCKSLALAQGRSEPGRPGPQEEVPEDAGGVVACWGWGLAPRALETPWKLESP